MDAPLCRLCGVKHWSQEPHAFKGSFDAYGEVVAESGVNGVNAEVVKSRAADRHKPGYMAKYMKERRLRKRSAGG